MRTFREQRFFSFFLVLFLILGTVELNRYLLFHFHTGSTVVLIPTGIAIAVVYLGGYRMWLPIAIAWFLATLTGPNHTPLLLIVLNPIAYATEAVIGGYILKQLKFRGDLARTRDALVLVFAALALPVVAPSIIVGVEWAAHAFPGTYSSTWLRDWSGGVLNIMVFTPVITTWYWNRKRKSPKELIETIIVLFALLLATYFAFWNSLGQVSVFIILYALFATLFWIGLRLHPRIITTALFLVAVSGIAGSLLTHPATGSVGQHLTSDELFIILIAPIFFILAALVEERRMSIRESQLRSQELEEANLKLSQEDQAKNEFLATLAHELRNPLAPIISSHELMGIKAQELGDQDLMQLVSVVQTHTSTLVRLLDDLLDISRISRKKFKLKKEIVELQPIVDQAVRTVDVLYKLRKHTLAVSIPKEAVWIEADPLRLEQILVNLLNNSAKYTNPGGHVELTITCDDQMQVRISIKDNGIGIEPHMFGKIFEQFMQSDEGSSGLGIGLWLTRRLTELHDGKVWVESAGLGKGSEFIVLLPGARSAQQPPKTQEQPRLKLLSLLHPASSQGARTILIVDDNEAAALGLKKLLEHRGHAVSVVHDGHSAIEHMRTAAADVVLLDIGLPDMDGYAVARALRQEHGSDPLLLIALTGYGLEEDKLKAKEAGFNYHLTKPISSSDVEAILTRGPSPEGE